MDDDRRRPTKNKEPPRKPRPETRTPREHHTTQQNKPMITSTTTIHDLDDASLEGILHFLPGHFRFVAGVNCRFRCLYVTLHTPDTLYEVAMASGATREIWLQEDEPNIRAGEGCRLAAKYSNLEALQWFRSRQCSWSSDVCTEAAGGGHLHILHWARSQTPPCPWNEKVCPTAALHGHLQVLQWLRSQTPPCPWDQCACAYAAGSGHLEVLQWLRSQTPPCPWNVQLCLGVSRRDSEVEAFIRSHL